MKQIWPTYAYSPTTNVLTLTGLNIDRDQLLLVTAADRGRIMYNFADSSVTASAFTSGVNTALTLVATTAGLTTTAALVIYFDDQATSSTVTGTVELGPTSLNALESITVTMGQVTVTGGLTDVQLRASAVTVGGTVTVGNSLTISSLPAISGTVTANPTGTQMIAGSVTLGASTAQIGSVTASISGTVPVSGTFFQGTQPVSLTTLPALVAGTAQIGSVTASISNSVTIASLPAISGTVTIGNTVTIAGTVTANPTGTQTIAGSVTLAAGTAQIGSVTASISGTVPVSISSVTIGSALPVGTNRIGVVTIGGGTVTIGAGTEQIGSVTASVSNTNFSIKAVVALDGSNSAIVPIPQSSFRLYTPVGASKTLNNIFGANPAWIAPYSDVISFVSDSGVQNNYLHDGTQWIRDDFTTPAGTDALNGSFIVFNLSAESGINLSNGFTFVQLDNPLVLNSAMRVSLYNSSVTANTFALQGTAVTTSNFTSTTASTLLAAANNNRKVLTIFNEGAGNLHICAGATCTTIAYQRKLASNEFFQVPDQQTAITHSAVFATAGTARIVQIT